MVKKTIKVSKSTSYTDKIGRLKKSELQYINCGVLKLALDSKKDLYITAGDIGVICSYSRPIDIISRYIYQGKVRENDIKIFMQDVIASCSLPERVALTKQVYQHYYNN